MSRYHAARLLLNAGINVPTINLEKVWHVGGEPKAGTKTQPPNSFEGTGLSVSNAPEEWRSIAELGDDTPVWEMRRRDGRPGRYMFAHRITP